MFVTKKTRRGKPRWIIEIPYRDRETGRRERFRKDADVQSKTGAEAEVRRLLHELEETGRIRTTRQKRADTTRREEVEAAERKVTFKDAYDTFLQTKATTRIKRTTRAGYVRAIETYMLPRWGSLPVADVGFVQFEKLDAELIKAGLKPSSRASILCGGRSVLRYCVDAHILPDMPRLPRLPKAGDVVLRIPDAAMIDKILAGAMPHLRLALLLATDAGLRAGEVRGLTWGDVDLTAVKLVVRRTYYLGAPDTPKSGHQREIPLTERLRSALEEAARRPHAKGDPVAPTSEGQIWAEPSLGHGLTSLLKRLGLPHCRFHDLRHYYVTRLFRAGVGAPTVRDLAGHRHMQVTARYAHSDEAAKRAAVDALDALERKAKASVGGEGNGWATDGQQVPEGAPSEEKKAQGNR